VEIVSPGKLPRQNLRERLQTAEPVQPALGNCRYEHLPTARGRIYAASNRDIPAFSVVRLHDFGKK
jgi:hypothetical protein